MTTPVHRAKAGLRRQVREQLAVMTGQQRETASLKIRSRLRRQTIWKSASSILFFAPLPCEPDIWPLLKAALLARKIVGLPRFSSSSKTYLAARIQNLERDLRPGQLGIREPTSACAEFPLKEFDLVLVPGVAFDLEGHRLGRGKGYYDRMLADVAGVKCGVAFDEQVVAAVPVGPSDVHLDAILTPRRWLKAKRTG